MIKVSHGFLIAFERPVTTFEPPPSIVDSLLPNFKIDAHSTADFREQDPEHVCVDAIIILDVSCGFLIVLEAPLRDVRNPIVVVVRHQIENQPRADQQKQDPNHGVYRKSPTHNGFSFLQTNS